MYKQKIEYKRSFEINLFRFPLTSTDWPFLESEVVLAIRYEKYDMRLLGNWYLQLCQIYNVLIKKHFLVFVRNR